MYYLNSAGTRIRVPNRRVRVYQNDEDLGTRAVDFCEMVGNFSTENFRLKGVRYSAFAESFERDEKGNPVVRI